MNPVYRRFLAWCAVFFILQPPAVAQDAPEVYGLGTRNSAAHAAGREFRTCALFRPATGSRHPDVVSEETLLELDPAVFRQLIGERPEAISISLKTESGATFDIELLRSRPVSATADLGIIDAGGRHRSGADEGLHYGGIVRGKGRSMASLSVFPDGEVMGLFSTEAGNFNLGKLEDGSGRFVLYNDRDLRVKPHSACQTADLAGPEGLQAAGSLKTTRSVLCRRVRVYWEISYNVFTSRLSDLTSTRNYVTALFNQVSTMYLNENIQLELSSMYIWVAPDEYPQNTSSAALGKFVQYWNFLGNSFNADLAHLITRDNGGNGGNGGLAYVDVLCNQSVPFGYSDIYGTVNAVPVFSWDVEVVTHETGHNLGSNHTHWCGWNTGTGGTCGAIDNCYTLQPSSGCNTCGSTFQNSAPVTAWKGTLMSYCHLVSRGINLANGFGPLPGAVIRSGVAGASCLGPLLKASLQTSPICAGSGSASVVFDPLNGGTAPYTYAWSNGDKTQTTSNLSVPAQYNVTVTDSNGCRLQLAARVAAKASAGDGVPVAPSIRMPVCCGSPTAKLELHSNMTANLSNCQTVYWLRTQAPVTSFAEAQQYFDTATVTLIPSKRVSAAGAVVDVDPPAVCNAPVSWYFTPVAVNRPHAADSVTFVTSANTPFTNTRGVQLGTYAVIPDQSAVPVGCDAADTPARSELVIRVSNYTGRPGRMSIMVRDASGTVVFQRSGYTGNGTYVLTPDSVRAPFLGDLYVYAFDYNCSSPPSCVASAAAIDLSRNVRYGGRKATMNAGCQVGTSIATSFANSGCTRLRVSNLNVVRSWNASLAPNPAGSSVSLRYDAGAALLKLDVTDVLGKRVAAMELPAGSGLQTLPLNVQHWAKGVYFFNLFDSNGNAQRMKLVLE